jgi:hypothetical protein
MDYRKIDEEEVIELLNQVRKREITVFKIDFEKGIESRKKVKREKCIELLRNFKTFFLNEDEILRHIQAFDREQEMEIIKNAGLMYDIMLF